MKTNLDPFAPVRLAPLAQQSKTTSVLQAVIATCRAADGTERDEIVGHVDKNYKLITNQQVVNTARDILSRAFPEAELKSDRTLFDGRQFDMRWPLPVDATVNCGGKAFIIHVTGSACNSYGGSLPGGLALNACAQVCTNGFVVRDRLGNFAFSTVEADSAEYEAHIEHIAREVADKSRWETVTRLFNGMAVSPFEENTMEELRRAIDLPDVLFVEIMHRITGETEWDFYMAATAALRDDPTFVKERWNRRISRYFLDRQARAGLDVPNPRYERFAAHFVTSPETDADGDRAEGLQEAELKS
jgi:hypothetical protein